MGSEITLTFVQIKKNKEIVNFKARKSRAQSSWPAQGGARVAIQMGLGSPLEIFNSILISIQN